LEVVLDDAPTCLFTAIDFKAWRKLQVPKKNFFDLSSSFLCSVNRLIEKYGRVPFAPRASIDG
jgi:hypothetical protein